MLSEHAKSIGHMRDRIGRIEQNAKMENEHKKVEKLSLLGTVISQKGNYIIYKEILDCNVPEKDISVLNFLTFRYYINFSTLCSFLAFR